MRPPRIADIVAAEPFWAKHDGPSWRMELRTGEVVEFKAAGNKMLSWKATRAWERDSPPLAL